MQGITFTRVDLLEMSARISGFGGSGASALAARLRRETTLSVRRIAERLHLGKPEGARANLHKWLKQPTSGTGQVQLGIR